MELHPEVLSHPHIPKPLHGLNPRTIKGQQWWDIERQKAYQSTNYHCLACGIHKSQAKYHQWLEAHEYYNYDNINKGILRIEKIIPLCHCCHNFIHSGKLLMDLQAKKIDLDRFKTILQHGMNICNMNNIIPFYWTIDLYNKIFKTNIPINIPIEDNNLKWSDYCLELEGAKYYSKFKDINEWSNHKW